MAETLSYDLYDDESSRVFDEATRQIANRDFKFKFSEGICYMVAVQAAMEQGLDVDDALDMVNDKVTELKASIG